MLYHIISYYIILCTHGQSISGSGGHKIWIHALIPMIAMRTGVVTGLLRCAITCHWLVVSTPLKNISQLFTQGGRRSHSQHAVTQTTGIEETRLASESSRKEKKE